MARWSDASTSYPSRRLGTGGSGRSSYFRPSPPTAVRVKRAKLRWRHLRRSGCSGADGSIPGSGGPNTKDEKGPHARFRAASVNLPAKRRLSSAAPMSVSGIHARSCDGGGAEKCEWDGTGCWREFAKNLAVRNKST